MTSGQRERAREDGFHYLNAVYPLNMNLTLDLLSPTRLSVSIYTTAEFSTLIGQRVRVNKKIKKKINYKNKDSYSVIRGINKDTTLRLIAFPNPAKPCGVFFLPCSGALSGTPQTVSRLLTADKKNAVWHLLPLITHKSISIPSGLF